MADRFWKPCYVRLHGNTLVIFNDKKVRLAYRNQKNLFAAGPETAPGDPTAGYVQSERHNATGESCEYPLDVRRSHTGVRHLRQAAHGEAATRAVQRACRNTAR